MPKNSESFSKAYAEAGVDITAGYKQVELIKSFISATHTKGVIGGIGGFGGIFAPDISGMKKPVFVSGTDGVGTKLVIAQRLDNHETIGIDCVAMCVNDIICAGAEPIFFLDYIAIGKNIPEKTAAIVNGVAAGCIIAGCALIGGETAEHPGVMADDDYDLAGFAVGIADEHELITQDRIKAGDALIALPSSGVHSNGFTLIRKIFGDSRTELEAYISELGQTLGEELLIPTRIYVKETLALKREIGTALHGAAHITGGGIYENAPRILPDGFGLEIDAPRIPKLPIFDLIQRRGDVSTRDMYNTFNMGVGMVFAVEANEAGNAMNVLKKTGASPLFIGEVTAGDGVNIIW